MSLTFEDLASYEDPGYYIVPNEDTVEWRKLIKGLRVNKAAAICSSGEVGLVAMLPTVRKELVLVDHSYASLSVAMLKYTMLRELGATETKRLLTAATPDELRINLDKFVATLPEKVRKVYAQRVNARSFERGFVINRPGKKYNYNKIDPKTGYYEVVEQKDNYEVNGSIVREWNRLPHRDVLRSASKLDRVKFLHGDLTDLAAKGPFDLFYLSNALEHSGRKGRPVVEQVQACIKPGGYAIVAHQGGLPDRSARSGYRSYSNYGSCITKILDAGWTVVSTVKSSVNIAWQQTLFQVPQAKAVAA